MRRALLTVVLCVSFAPLANAQMRGGYAGISIGEFSFEQHLPQASGAALSDVGMSFGGFGGYRFSDKFAIEGSWDATVDLDLVDGVLDVFFGSLSSNVTEDYKILTARALGIAQINRVGLFAGLGYHHSAADATATVRGAPVHLETSDGGLTATAGVQIDFQRMSSRLQYEWFDADSGQNRSRIAVGWLFRF